jgi:hypothetical protein
MPTGKLPIVKVAVPRRLILVAPTTREPSLKVTRPVGRPPNAEPRTVPVKVMG